MAETASYPTANRQTHPGQMGIDIYQDGMKFSGQQEYTLGRSTLQLSNIDEVTLAKHRASEPFFTSANFNKRTVLDIECNSGFFALLAVQLGASQVTALDTDEACLSIVAKASAALGIQHLQPEKFNLVDWNQPADLVMALGTLHSMHCYISSLESLCRFVEKLADLTRYGLLIEWVEPHDSAISCCPDHQFDIDCHRPFPGRDDFEAALSKYFAKIELLGKVSETRSIYSAFKTDHATIDLGCPLPDLLDKTYIISSKQLYSLNGIDYWSRIYDAGSDIIIKQTSAGLALRESKFLEELSGEYFPRVLSSSVEAEYSVFYMEKINGTVLWQVHPSLFEDTDSFYELVSHCLKIICELQSRGIVHRNIFADNIILRNSKPVLIDFGWSEKAGNACIIPLSLPRAPDGQPCDIYSLAETLHKIGAGRYPELDRLFSLMMDNDPSLRITDARTLLFLLEGLKSERSQAKTFDTSGSYAWVTNVLDNLTMRAAQNSFLRTKFAAVTEHNIELLRRVNDFEKRNIDSESKLKESQVVYQQLQALCEQLESEVLTQRQVLSEIAKSRAWRVGSFLQRIYAKLASLKNWVARLLGEKW